MYEHYWNLQNPPFHNDANTNFYYESQSHRASLLKMEYILDQEYGAGLLVGESGVGKSFLMKRLLERQQTSLHPVVQLLYPKLSAEELFSYLARALTEPTDPEVLNGTSFDQTLHKLQQSLQDHTSEGRHPFIVIDQAHLIEDVQVFQALQLFLNYLQHPDIQFTLVMVGDPTLLDSIRRIGSLESRIPIRALLQPFTLEETADYVLHRLRLSGGTRNIFEVEALLALFELSSGIPQVINRLCDLSLLVGYSERLEVIGRNEIEAVAEELTLMIPD